MTTDTNARPTTPAPRPAPQPPAARVSRRVVAWTITVGGLRVGWWRSERRERWRGRAA